MSLRIPRYDQSQGGGASSPAIPYFTTTPTAPKASDFTLSTTSGVVGSLATLGSGLGTEMLLTSTTSLLGQMATLNGYTPPASGDFSFEAFVIGSPTQNPQGFGICLVDSAGLVLHWGTRNSDVGGSEWNSLSSVNAGYSIFTPTPFISHAMWLRLARVGSNLHFDHSVDGETWITLQTTTATAFLGATLAKIGLFQYASDNTPFAITCYSFTHTP